MTSFVFSSIRLSTKCISCKLHIPRTKDESSYWQWIIPQSVKELETIQNVTSSDVRVNANDNLPVKNRDAISSKIFTLFKNLYTTRFSKFVKKIVTSICACS